ncbi:MAG: Asp-tRNA(Asn)/Glu-tRNA(Gln) amidotransferase subunit GatC [Candidatus Azosocius agrarius]|nr:MAG: Asp-tRNA(Asn)/Glu-tRNA(Gln) amidotransferase subunit GatC [Gammaproteobacteria bacterium]
MIINLNDIKKLSELSALKIYNNKKKDYKIKILFELNQILKILNKINEINIDNIDPIFHPIKKYQTLNKDQIELKNYSNKIKNLNKNNMQNNFYIVSKIIDK